MTAPPSSMVNAEATVVRLKVSASIPEAGGGVGSRKRAGGEERKPRCFDGGGPFAVGEALPTSTHGHACHMVVRRPPPKEDIQILGTAAVRHPTCTETGGANRREDHNPTRQRDPLRPFATLCNVVYRVVE